MAITQRKFHGDRDVKIVVPFATLLKGQVRMLEDYALDVEYIDTSGDDEAYWRLLCELWQAQQTFVIIEHDVFPWPGAVERLIECDCEWGGYSYYIEGVLYDDVCFGCTKFEASLLSRTQGVIESMDGRWWHSLDSRVRYYLRRQMVGVPHVHRPPVVHLKGGCE